MTDEGNSLITKFNLKYELHTIDTLHLFGDIMNMEAVALRFAP